MVLDPAAAERVEAAFDEAQRKTRAPLVCVLARASMSLEAEFLLGASLLALATPAPLLLFTHLSAQRIYIAQLIVGIVAAVLGSIAWLRQAAVPRRLQRAASHRAALAQFMARGLDRSGCGVLIYVSLAERYVRIVAAKDATGAVSARQWQGVVDEALAPLATGANELALGCLAERCADLLARPFPPPANWAPPPQRRFHIV